MASGKRVKPSGLSKELKRVGSVATKKEFAAIMQKLSMDAFRELILRSAVDTGFLRSNWDVTTGTASNTILKDVDGGAFDDASWPAVKIETGDSVVLFNNTSYAGYLETGTPNMRSWPMVEPTYHRTLTQAKKLTADLSKEKVS